ncbi:MAG: thiopurine S-methyltransferase [Pseudomonadota bacterium]
MDPEFWIERWQMGHTGFHLSHTNPWLEKCWPLVAAPVASTIFVPLCGKSLDLLWLRNQGFQVLGVEVSQLAVKEFFAEHALQPRVDRSGAFERWRCDGITLLVGDFFALEPGMVADVAAVYDRASLIALPGELRRRYVGKMGALFAAALPTLLITLEYDQQQMSGPPFSVAFAEVESLYRRRFSISQICSEEILDAEPRFRSKGVTSLIENVYLLKPQESLQPSVGSS